MLPDIIFVIPEGIHEWVAVYHDADGGSESMIRAGEEVFGFAVDGTFGAKRLDDVLLRRRVLVAKRPDGTPLEIVYTGRYSGPEGKIVFYSIGATRNDLIAADVPVSRGGEILTCKLVDRRAWERDAAEGP